MKNFLLLALGGTILITVFLIRYDTVRPRYQAGDSVRISGLIDQDVQIIDGRQRLSIGSLRIYLDRFPEYQYGERIIAEGEVAEGKAGYFLKDPKVVKVEDVEKVWEVREEILEIYKKFLPQPHGALVAGIVLGTKSSLENDFFEKLKNSGTLHVVVASGTNIALFSGVLINLTAFIWGRKRAIFISFVLVWVYVTLIGLQPPIVRAAIMGSIAFFAQYLGKEESALRALVISALVMLLVFPLWLFDLGFQLSFLATASMVAFSGKISGVIGKVRVIRWLPKILKESLSTTLAAQIGVTPLLFYSFGQISLISPLVNMLVLPVVPLIMAGGFVLALAGLIFEPVAQIIAWFLWLPLEWFVRIVTLFGSI